MTRRVRWNHNLHYHPLVLAAVPADARRVLDVGCGEGWLTRELCGPARHVVGIDRDAPSLARARAGAVRTDGLDFVLGDFLVHPFEPGSFDAVVSIAALHHVEAASGLARLRALLRPGGTLVLVGLARSSTLADHALDAAGVLTSCVLRLWRRHVEVAAPTLWPPPESYASQRAIAGRELPGARMQRLLLFRYLLVWTKPEGGSA